MSETINITVIDQDEPISITITEEAPINVNFYEIAVPDPRVSTARTEAIAAQAAAETAQEAAEEAAVNAASAAASAVTGEAVTRAAADVTLQTNIDTEAAARIAADALLIPLTQKSSANGVASLDSAGKVPLAQLPSSIMEYQGVYNATTNTPTLSDYASGAAAGDNVGNVYRVTVAGSQNFGSGSISFTVGDYVILNALGKWEKSDTTDAVASVNGYTGVVTVTVDSTAGSETDKSPSVNATKSLVSTHAGLTSSHGVSGNIVGTSDTQTLTNKTIVAASNTITTASSGSLTATELNAVIVQIATQLAAAAGAPSGVVSPFAGTSAPAGWFLCDGSAVSRSTYSTLYTAIGTAYGIGDGSTTFNLPDMRGAFVRGRVGIANVTGSGSASTNNATFTAHGYNRTGTKARITSGTLSGLSVNTDYYLIVIDANTLAFSTTYANAIAGTKIAITGANSAVLAQWEDPDASSRVAVNGGNSGTNVGARQADAMQGHRHQFNAAGVVAAGGAGSAQYKWDNVGFGSAVNAGYILDPITDGTNGTPRTSSETRPTNISMNYIIKY